VVGIPKQELAMTSIGKLKISLALLLNKVARGRWVREIVGCFDEVVQALGERAMELNFSSFVKLLYAS
jgi:hypothetical protein